MSARHIQKDLRLEQELLVVAAPVPPKQSLVGLVPQQIAVSKTGHQQEVLTSR